MTVTAQLDLFDTSHHVGDWCSDDWETPDWLAQQMASLIDGGIYDTRILEPAAGSGQIAKYLPAHKRPVCIEPNPRRFWKAQERFGGNTDFHWGCAHFPLTEQQREYVCEDRGWQNFEFDLVITNPPFSQVELFVTEGLKLLRETFGARLLYLLPLDWMCTQGAQSWWLNLDARIHRIYYIPTRVAYLKNGVPQSGRRRYDAIFDIRPTRHNHAGAHGLWEFNRPLPEPVGQNDAITPCNEFFEKQK